MAVGSRALGTYCINTDLCGGCYDAAVRARGYYCGTQSGAFGVRKEDSMRHGLLLSRGTLALVSTWTAAFAASVV